MAGGISCHIQLNTTRTAELEFMPAAGNIIVCGYDTTEENGSASCTLTHSGTFVFK